jgi:hypothetical protein
MIIARLAGRSACGSANFTHDMIARYVAGHSRRTEDGAFGRQDRVLLAQCGM